ncbi:glycoside hydrolase family 3 C-terminal domain-containing protein [Phytoactinopolyspora limicola]|uniref:glycoside hydrolase family 3 C-terminal domain-containing protein n=1 Tax=Phytoactinopolyspora limicola TaxID=2715536 RepID=UPI00140BBCB5|nr:glycoside hydrolase family 3 C-terminal domain-containing protein [Phytoactinopolyspora limicola]
MTQLGTPPAEPIDDEELRERVERLTLEQKIRLLTGADKWRLHVEPAVGLGQVVLSDGPSGVRGAFWDERDPSVNLPSATALGATWDAALAYRYGAALAAEARVKGAHVVLGPTINLHRTPLGGRHFEAFSEDPLLTSRLCASYVRGVQDNGIGACPKHYVANEFETDRKTVNMVAGERVLREVYLAAFEDTVITERPWLVMAAYNFVNGAAMTENPLLAEPLCGEWGFDGVVVSDWGAVYSVEPAARARMDLRMPGPDRGWGLQVLDAVRAGRVNDDAVDEKVIRLLRLAGRVGVLDGVEPVVASSAPPVDGAELAREVAADGMVLVRNNDNELPWNASTLGSVAVIGNHALVPRSQGGGSARVAPAHVVSPLEGLRQALPGTQISWTLGAAVAHGKIAPLALDSLSDPVTGEPGIRVRFLDAQGEELLSENRRSADLAALNIRTRPDVASVEARTRYLPPHTGTVQLGVATRDPVQLAVDGSGVLEAGLGRADNAGLDSPLLPRPVSTPIEVTAGRPVELLVRLDVRARGTAEGPFSLTIGIDHATSTPQEEIAAAVRAAREADVAVVVVGTSDAEESEGYDRTTLALAGGQDELVHAVAAANPRTVVVVNAGAPVLMPWRHEVAAVLLTWFGGQEFGHALADVLLGVVEPGGRLPTTWPAAEADVPLLATAATDGAADYDDAGVHVGYRAWLKSGAEPAYPFGFGLGYTTWQITDLQAPQTIRPGESLDVIVTVRNTGHRDGKYVAQLYLSRDTTEIDRARRWLAGYAVVRARAGSEESVTIKVPARAFAHWDNGWHTECGPYTIHVGPHINDLPHRGQVDIH